jgi:hypothetical protein
MGFARVIPGATIAHRGEPEAPPPEGPVPLVSLDFKNGDYAIQGVAKMLAEVVEDNAEWSSYYSGSFSAGQITADVGLVPAIGTPAMPALTAEAQALVIGGFVLVMSYRLTDPDESSNGISIARTDFPDAMTYQELVCEIRLDEFDVLGSRAGITTSIMPAETRIVPPIEICRTAAQFDDTQVGAALNGQGPAMGPADITNPPNFVGIVAYAFGAGTVIVEKIEFFDLADYAIADLDELSTL